MEKHIVSEGQDLFDVALQRYGDIENTFDMLALNEGVNIDTRVVSRQELNYDAEDLGVVNVKEFYTLNNFVVMNADEEQLTTNVGDYSNDFSNDMET